MNLPRRHFLKFIGATVAAPVLPRLAIALDYPTKPLRLVVGFAAGGLTDTIARIIGQWLSDRLGQQSHRRKQDRRRHKHCDPIRGDFATRWVHAAFGYEFQSRQYHIL